MKKTKLLVLLICLLILTGCGKKMVTVSPSNIKSTDDLEKTEGSITCTRNANIKGNATPSFKYYLSYKDGNILVLHSVEKVTSDDQTLLDQYENSYKTINEKYKNLEYYDTNVYRVNNSVTRDAVINYEKIDTDKLAKIESSSNDIVVNKKAKLNNWLDFVLKYGVTCDED